MFDGYKSKITKDHEHERRTLKHQTCAEVLVKEDTNVYHPREEFLKNEKNKEQLIKCLARYLRDDGHTVIECEGDADTHIIEAALDIVCQGKDVTVVADDTDIFIMLLYYWNSEMGEIFMRSEARKNQNLRLVNIKKVLEHLNCNVIKNLLFIHAWGGCNTTSAIFNQGKTVIMNLIEKETPDVLHVCSIFAKTSVTQEEIGHAGIRLFVKMYGM